MPQVKLYLFGPPQLEVNQQRIVLSLRKMQALLAYLAVTAQPHSRDHLATLFWPEANQRRARANLRQMTFNVANRVGEALLISTQTTIGLDSAIDLWVDVKAFEALVHQENGEELERLQRAAGLYTDHFMAGFNLNDCPEFDEWQFFQREALRQQLAQILQRLTEIAAAQADYENALPYARRWLALDPLEELAHRRLMQLYALAGQQAAAVRQYDECVRILEQELGVPPEEETTALFQAIRMRRFPASDSVAHSQQRTLLNQRQSRGQPQVTSSEQPRGTKLPVLPTPFVGRKQEITAIIQRITDPTCRLLTLVGPGGIGKTRLALEVARRLSDDATLKSTLFGDGVYFVALQPITSSEHIVPAIAEIVGYELQEERSLHEQLLAQLADQALLLVLDNFEHLLDAIDLIGDMQTAASNVKLLITSRDALPLQQAWFHPIAGMYFPKVDETVDTQIAAYDAMQLFAQCARRNQVDYSLEKELAQTARICRLVEGMPLALELAATWLKVLSTAEVADEIAESLDLLAAQNHNIPERHHSIRAVFDHTWQRLSTAEQELLKRLSIFRGGYSRHAAEVVASARLPVLASLAEKTLIRRNGSGRYEIHELIRQFAAEHLQSMPEEYDELGNRHSQYFATLLNRQEETLKGSKPQQALTEIGADLDNIRLGWRWAAEQQGVQTLNQGVESLYLFYEARGLLQEGVETFRYALAQFDEIDIDRFSVEDRSAIGQLFARCGGLEIRLGHNERGIAFMRAGEQILRPLAPVANPALARVLSHLGQEVHRQGHYQEALRILQESLQLSTEAGDEWMMGLTLMRLGQVAEFQGEYVQADPYFQQSLALFDRVGEQRFRAFALNNQGRVAYAVGEYDRAKQLITQAVQIREALADQVGLAYSQLDLGRLATLTGDYHVAQTHLEEALTIAKRLGERDLMARCLNAQGVVMCLLGDYDCARELHQRSDNLFRELNVQVELPAICTYLGCVALYQGAWAEAYERLQEGYRMGKQIMHQGVMATTLRYLGHLHVLSTAHNGQMALDYYRQAVDIASGTNAVPVIVDSLAGIARYLIRQGEFNQAASLLAQLIQQPSSTYATRANCQTLLAELNKEAPIAHNERAALLDQTPDWQALINEYLP